MSKPPGTFSIKQRFLPRKRYHVPRINVAQGPERSPERTGPTRACETYNRIQLCVLLCLFLAKMRVHGTNEAHASHRRHHRRHRNDLWCATFADAAWVGSRDASRREQVGGAHTHT